MKRIIIFTLSISISLLFLTIGLIIAQGKHITTPLESASKSLNSNILEHIKIKKGEQNSCTECHKNFPASHPVGKAYINYAKSIHFEKGLQCVECHGGDSSSLNMKVSMNKKNGFIGVPSRKDIALVCARCHSDKSIMESHNSKLQTDQMSKYMSSAHGKQLISGDFGAAVCTDCHNHHDILAKKNINSSVFANNIANTCAKCHPKNAELFLKGPHKEAFSLKEEPQCISCHGHHDATRKSHALISLGDASCSDCHTTKELKEDFAIEGEPSIAHATFEKLFSKKIKKEQGICNKCHHANKAAVADIKKISTELTISIMSIDRKLKTAEHKGVQSPNNFMKLAEMKTVRAELATMNHEANPKTYKAKYETVKKEAETLSSDADKLLEEIAGRKIWFGTAALVITFLIVVLILKIRDMEQRQRKEND